MPDRLEADTITPARRAAIVVSAMGANRAAEVLKRLPKHEAEQVILELAQLDLSPLPSEQIGLIIDRASAMIDRTALVVRGGQAEAELLLRSVYGDEVAEEVLTRLQAERQGDPFVFLHEKDAKDIAVALEDEYPQAVALVLSYVSPKKTADVLAAFVDKDKALDVAVRIGQLRGARDGETVQRVQKWLFDRLGGAAVGRSSYSSDFDGRKYLVELVTDGGRKEIEEKLLPKIQQQDKDLYDEIQQKMFDWGDLDKLSDPDLEKAMRKVIEGTDEVKVSLREFATALKACEEGLLKRILSTLTSDNRTEVEDFLQNQKVRSSVVSDARAKVLSIVRPMATSKEIKVLTGDDDTADILV